MAVIIYHNPACGTSRNTLALIRHFGIDPTVIEYLKTPPSREDLAAILIKAGLTPHQAARKKGTPYAELGLAGASDDAVLDAMIAHPVLINRPLVVSDTGAALCRPSDAVLDLLPAMTANDAFKEEGAPFLRDTPIGADDAGLNAALRRENLAVDDLSEAGRRFFVYRNLSGAMLGYGGYELYGSDALLRSVIVETDGRGHGIGRNLVALTCYRALRQGARTAWLLTTTAADFFEKLKFKRRAREDAPDAILETRQAQSLCPASAVLLSKKLEF